MAISLLGIPFDENSSFLTGPAKAPAIIRECIFSDSANTASENEFDLKQTENWSDVGDVEISDSNMFFENVRSKVITELENGNKVLSLGGDHSVTYPIIDAYAQFYKDLTIIHFDAHPDLYDDFEGNPMSHASPFARIMEKGLVKNLIQIGIRTANQHLREQIERFNVTCFEMKSMKALPSIMMEGPIYISFDIDALDPAYAPGVSHIEPGGLTVRDALTVIQNIKGKIVGADVVEYNPNQDFNRITGMVAAKITKEIMDKLHQ
jgi:arginase